MLPLRRGEEPAVKGIPRRGHGCRERLSAAGQPQIASKSIGLELATDDIRGLSVAAGETVPAIRTAADGLVASAAGALIASAAPAAAATENALR
jgi:hypothetical protein